LPEFRSLIEGYHRFRAGNYLVQKQRWQELAEGQEPPVMVIGCCDSRVDPGMIFDTHPGQVFVLRNVANLVPPYEPDTGHHGASAAIEFAVTGLQVRHIVVLGHGACGGIAACLQGGDQGAPGRASSTSGCRSWPRPAMPFSKPRRQDPQRALELEAVKVSLRNLRSFPWVRERETEGSLKLHGAYFAIAEGVLHVLDEATGSYRPA
jgi:carbonic anhydrase